MIDFLSQIKVFFTEYVKIPGFSRIPGKVATLYTVFHLKQPLM